MNSNSNHHHNHLKRWATYASSAVALTLIVFKLIAYISTDSVAVLASLLDSTLDMVASIVTVFGVASALRPPDHNHRFGHGKAEPLTALTQAAFIVGSSVFLGYESLSRVISPHLIERPELGYYVMGASIVITLVLVIFQRVVIRRTQSIAIDADHSHYLGDLLVNVAVLLSLFLGKFFKVDWFDPLCAMLVSGGLVFSAIRIAKLALSMLMDEELPNADREQIKKIIRSFPLVLGVHDMRTRFDSDRIYVECHIELNGDLPLREAHIIVDDIMAGIKAEFPKADVFIHQDPQGLQEDRLDQIIGTP